MPSVSLQNHANRWAIFSGVCAVLAIIFTLGTSLLSWGREQQRIEHLEDGQAKLERKLEAFSIDDKTGRLHRAEDEIKRLQDEIALLREALSSGIGEGSPPEALISAVATQLMQEHADTLRGPSGPAGPKGEPGPPGPQGPRGEPGNRVGQEAARSAPRAVSAPDAATPSRPASAIKGGFLPSSVAGITVKLLDCTGGGVTAVCRIALSNERQDRVRVLMRADRSRARTPDGRWLLGRTYSGEDWADATLDEVLEPGRVTIVRLEFEEPSGAARYLASVQVGDYRRDFAEWLHVKLSQR